MKKKERKRLFDKIFKSDCFEDGPPLWHSSYKDKEKWIEKCNNCSSKKVCHKRQERRISKRGMRREER